MMTLWCTRNWTIRSRATIPKLLPDILQLFIHIPIDVDVNLVIYTSIYLLLFITVQILWYCVYYIHHGFDGSSWL